MLCGHTLRVLSSGFSVSLPFFPLFCRNLSTLLAVAIIPAPATLPRIYISLFCLGMMVMTGETAPPWTMRSARSWGRCRLSTPLVSPEGWGHARHTLSPMLTGLVSARGGKKHWRPGARSEVARPPSTPMWMVWDFFYKLKKFSSKKLILKFLELNTINIS